jgi:polar amino acid transport system substrate-binding protein
VDVLCYTNSDWMEETHPNFRWSAPFIIQHDVLVGRTSESIRPEELKGEVVGAVLGFIYPTLDPLFADKKLLREDARTQAQVLLMLKAGRYRYAVSDMLSLNYFNVQRSLVEQLWPVSDISSSDVSCLVRDDQSVPTQALLESIARLKETGVIEEIINKYR